MESETIDMQTITDGDFGDPFVLWQEVVLPVIHCTIRECKWIVTPCSILEYHVEHKINTSISLFRSIVFPSNHLIVR